MSVSRRMAVAGLPAAGVTVFAALAFTGGPAVAVGDTAARPIMTTPCAQDSRTTCGYGDDAVSPGATSTGHTRGHSDYGTTTPPGTGPATTPPGTGPATTPPGTTPPGTSPTTPPVGTAPATTPPGTSPTGGTDTVPPTGVSPTTYSPYGSVPRPTSSQGGGVSAGSTLPVTGPPMGTVISIGGLLVAAGAASVLYTRRRRSA
jgi:LPXTG-motif cell wall-anchored protein